MQGWREWNLYCIKNKKKRIYYILLKFSNFPSSFHLTTNIAAWAPGMKESTIPYKYRNTKWPRDHSQGEVYDSVSANANSTLSTEHSPLRIWPRASHSLYRFLSLRPGFTSLNGCTLQKTLYSLLYQGWVCVTKVITFIKNCTEVRGDAKVRFESLTFSSDFYRKTSHMEVFSLCSGWELTQGLEPAGRWEYLRSRFYGGLIFTKPSLIISRNPWGDNDPQSSHLMCIRRV